MRVAAVQMCSTGDKGANLAVAGNGIAGAAADGSELVVLPEMFNCLGPGAVLREGAEPLDGPTAQWAAEQAQRHGVHLVAGSFVASPDPGDEDQRNRNTTLVFDPSGDRIAVYRKIHLFDVTVPGAEYHESDVLAPGDEIVHVPLDLKADAGDGAPVTPVLGLSICYDLRFPELFRTLAVAGATIIALPAAFTAKTGPPHWEVLLRARAIENQAFVIAAGQHGSSSEKLHWHGHSMIIDPWGTVLAAAPDPQRSGLIMADLDFAELARVRDTLPSLANRRLPLT